MVSNRTLKWAYDFHDRIFGSHVENNLDFYLKMEMNILSGLTVVTAYKQVCNFGLY
jgi:hypothetical protein